MNLYIRCRKCGGSGPVADSHEGTIVEDGAILWGMCDDCGTEICLDCIVSMQIEELDKLEKEVRV